MAAIAVTNTFNFITPIKCTMISLQDKPFDFALLLNWHVAFYQQRVHTMYPYLPGHFLGLLLSPQSVLLTLGHVHPFSLMPSPCCCYSHKHSQTCSSTLCSHVFMYLAWCAHWHPLLLKHTLSFTSLATLHNGTTSSVQLFFLTMSTLEIHLLPYRSIYTVTDCSASVLSPLLLHSSGKRNHANKITD